MDTIRKSMKGETRLPVRSCRVRGGQLRYRQSEQCHPRNAGPSVAVCRGVAATVPLPLQPMPVITASTPLRLERHGDLSGRCSDVLTACWHTVRRGGVAGSDNSAFAAPDKATSARYHCAFCIPAALGLFTWY